MNELVTLITQRTGIPSPVAEEIVKIVSGYLENRLPGPMASEVRNALGTQPAGSSGSSQSTGTAPNQGKGFLGNIFGSKGEDQPTQQ